MLVMSLSYTHQSHKACCAFFLSFFLVYVAIIECLNYNRYESEKQFPLYDPKTPVTLKHGQGHQPGMN